MCVWCDQHSQGHFTASLRGYGLGSLATQKADICFLKLFSDGFILYLGSLVCCITQLMLQLAKSQPDNILKNILVNFKLYFFPRLVFRALLWTTLTNDLEVVDLQVLYHSEDSVLLLWRYRG